MSLWRRVADYTSAADIRELGRRMRAAGETADAGLYYSFFDKTMLYGLRGMSVLGVPAAVYDIAIDQPGLAILVGVISPLLGIGSVRGARMHGRDVQEYEDLCASYRDDVPHKRPEEVFEQAFLNAFREGLTRLELGWGFGGRRNTDIQH